MTKNLTKRIITSFFLLLIFFIVNYSNSLIFILTILTVGTIICVEANNLYSKIFTSYYLKQKTFSKKFNFNFLILNIITFFYVFFVFCYYSYKIHEIEGPTFFLYVICICFFTDIGGYVFGKTFGGKKLTRISPNKTISGSIGSFIFAILTLIIFINLEYLNIQLNQNNIIYCFFVSLISQIGDLFISYLKRKAKIKDTGKILPGHGGVLDRLDGIIFAVPFSYLILKLI
jgi:phosphatidate cytidylyltransferase